MTTMRTPELVGPAEAREDISGQDVRSLVVRVVDWQLHFEHTFGPLIRELAGLHRGHDDHERRIRILETGPMRDKEPSYHDFSEELQRADANLRARVNNKRDPMTSDRARALAKEVVTATESGIELTTWRSIKAFPKRLGAKAAEHAVTLLVGGGLVYLWHLLSHPR